jgi:hypothetical protein
MLFPSKTYPTAGHLLLYWMHKDFTQWFLKFHDTTKEPVLRVNIPHMRFIIVSDPAIAQNVLGGAALKSEDVAATRSVVYLHVT